MARWAKKKHGSAHVDQHGLQGIVTVSYKMYRDTYRNTYQISQYVSFVDKVYRYIPSLDS
jgi:hypothetical protein